MLILSRKESEQVCLGNNIVLTIVRLANDKVRIGVTAPNDVKVLRAELKVTPVDLKIHDAKNHEPKTLVAKVEQAVRAKRAA